MVKNRSLTAWTFCFPAIVTLFFVAAWPLLRTFVFSFSNGSLDGLDAQIEWVGFDNYVTLFKDSDWWVSVKNTLQFAGISIFFETVLGLAFALLLNETFKGRGIARAALLVPWAIPTVVSAKMWSWMFNDMYGIINHLLMTLHIIDTPISWLADEQWTKVALVCVDVWKTTPFMALLILAGLQIIPKSLYEAARLEGVNMVQRFWYITLPHLLPSLCVALIFRTLDALRCFDLFYIMTSNSKSLSVISVYARQQIVDFQDVGYGSAVSFMIFCIVGSVSILYFGFSKKAIE